MFKRGFFLGTLIGLLALSSNLKNARAEDYIVIQNGTGIQSSEVGSSYMYEGHRRESEEGLDSNDVLRSTSGSTKTNWLSIFTEIEGTKYRKEFRPEESETVFTNYLSIVGEVSNCPNRLSFSASDLESDRVYTILINHYKTSFNVATNMREVNSGTGNIELPPVTGTNGEIYASVLIASKQIRAPKFESINITTNINLETRIQPGSFYQLQTLPEIQSTNGVYTTGKIDVSNSTFNADLIEKKYTLPCSSNNYSFFKLRSSAE